MYNKNVSGLTVTRTTLTSIASYIVLLAVTSKRNCKFSGICPASWFILWGISCLVFVLLFVPVLFFFNHISIGSIMLGEERADLCASRALTH